MTFAEDRCGAGSLALVLSARGASHSPEELEASLPDVDGRGVLSVDMLLAARARGFDAALLAGKAAGHALLVVRTRDETDAVLGRAMALESERRFEEAEALYREVLEVRPDS